MSVRPAGRGAGQEAGLRKAPKVEIGEREGLCRGDRLAEPLTVLTQGTFVLVALLTTLDAARHRDRARAEIAAMFLAFGVVIVIGWLKPLGVGGTWISLAAAAMMLAQPFLLLRVAGRLQPIPRPVILAAGAGYVGSVAALATPTLAGGAEGSFPTWALLVMVGYFVLGEGWAAYALLRGAVTTTGVTRWRSALASAGSGFLALLFVVAGVAGAAKLRADALSDATSALGALAAVAYYLGFAPPAALVRMWQSVELRRFIERSTGATVEERAERTLALLPLSAARATGAVGHDLAIAGGDGAAFAYLDGRGAPAEDSLLARAVRDGQATWGDESAALGADERARAAELGAASVLAVPLATEAGARGGILLYLPRRGLFAQDDAALVTLLAGQAALAHEHRLLVREQAALLERMDEANADLRRSNLELEQFAYVASHDLQEPLRIITGYTQLLARRYKGKLDPSADMFIQHTVEGTARMQMLINDLLAYSRVGTRAGPMAETDLTSALETAVANLRMAADETKAEVTHDPLPRLAVDRTQFVQLFQNLVGNAIKFHGKEPPRVHVSASRSNGTWELSVRDNGIGIDPQYADRIFVIFQRLHTRDEYPGTGIGLAICKKIVERHGGQIRVVSTPGQGADFRFTIPASGATP